MDQTKIALRKTQLNTRKRVHKHGADASFAVVSRVPEGLWPGQNEVVSGYFPIRTEFDPRPLMEEFQKRNSRLCLPVMNGPEEALSFHPWKSGEDLVQGRFGVHEPSQDQPELVPDFVLVPLLAVDLMGRRLGYGKGYYDRTLSQLRQRGSIVSVGLAYEAQIVDRVPVDPHDQCLDWVVTEKGAYRTGA